MVTQLCGFPLFFPSGRAGRSENVEEPLLEEATALSYSGPRSFS